MTNLSMAFRMYAHPVYDLRPRIASVYYPSLPCGTYKNYNNCLNVII